MVSQSLQYATQQFNHAESQFAQAGHAASTFFAHRNAVQKLQQAHQNALLVTDAKLDQQRAIDKAVTAVQQANPDDPNSWADHFSDQMADIKDTLLAPFKDPGAREMAMRQLNPMLEAGRGNLQTLAPRMINAKIDGQLASIPERMATEIGKIDSTLPPEAQLALYKQTMLAGTASYQELAKQSANLPGKLGQIQEAAGKLHQATSKQLAGNAIANIPDTEAGLKVHDAWDTIINHAEKFGLDIPEKAPLISALRTQKNQSIQTQVTGIKSDTATAMSDIKIQQAHLAENYDNPEIRKRLTKDLLDTSSDLQAQLAQEREKKPAPGSPEEMVHKEKLTSISQQIGQLVGAETEGLREKNSYEALQRQLVSFSQGQIKFQEGQLQFQQGQATKAATAEHKASLATYNDQMTPLFRGMDAILGMPTGQAKINAAQAHANKMVDAADAGRISGAINADQYEGVLKQAKNLIHQSEFKHADGFFGLGANDHAPNTPQEKMQATIDAAKRMQSASKAGQVNVGTIGTLIDMADTAITDKGELGKVKAYLTAHGQEQLDKARKAGQTDEQIEKNLPAYLQSVQQLVRKAPDPPPTLKQLGDAGTPHTLPAKSAPITKGFAAAPKVAE